MDEFEHPPGTDSGAAQREALVSDVVEGEETETTATTHLSTDNIVILKSDPNQLPMVCGLCGSQYATCKGNPAYPLSYVTLCLSLLWLISTIFYYQNNDNCTYFFLNNFELFLLCIHLHG